jgi:hypothetical protein
MPINLLAMCKQPNGVVVKRVKVTAEVQNQLEGVFIQQEQTFLDGVNEEVAFDGGWNPEPNELLYVDLTDDAKIVLQAAQGNVVALPEVNAAAFGQENIRALVVMIRYPAGPRLLLQEFSPRQSLDRRFSLVLDGDTFSRLTQPAFSIGASLAGIVENGRIKFRRFSRIKLVFKSPMRRRSNKWQIRRCENWSTPLPSERRWKTTRPNKSLRPPMGKDFRSKSWEIESLCLESKRRLRRCYISSITVCIARL